jgi:ubiquinone/menaquinone biosynthesis C-methylase UbiE
MFFSDKIVSIDKDFYVLEVGPGGTPHPRADVLLDKKFEDENETVAQRGFAPGAKTNKKLVFYNGGVFPFGDKEFDYVICAHVLEHIPYEDLPFFISELQRVSKRGYIEFPSIFYEFVNHQDVHKWYMNYRNDTVLFLDKKVFKSNFIHKIVRELFYGQDNYMREIFTRYRELFFCYFEWTGNFEYKIVSEYDELVNEEDHLKFSTFFKHFKYRKHFSLNPYMGLKKIIYETMITLVKK